MFKYVLKIEFHITPYNAEIMAKTFKVLFRGDLIQQKGVHKIMANKIFI